MSELLHNFFERDLSDEEFESLGSVLESDAGAAEAFSGLAAKAYEATGLPTPSWSARAAESRSSIVPWVLTALIGLGLAGVAGVGVGLMRLTAPGMPVLSDDQAPFEEVAAPKARPRAPRSSVVPVDERPAADLAQDMARVRMADPQPEVNAFLVRGDDGRQRLRVSVDAPTVSEVRLRVLELNGQEVRGMYKGRLTPGRHDFDWDGRRADGEQAPEGKYRLELLCGGRLHSKIVTVSLR
jgi:hypothetical protein